MNFMHIFLLKFIYKENDLLIHNMNLYLFPILNEFIYVKKFVNACHHGLNTYTYIYIYMCVCVCVCF